MPVTEEADHFIDRSVFGGETALSDDATPEQIQQRINEIRRAHLITFAIVLGIYICIWTPYLVFSLIVGHFRKSSKHR